MIAGCGVLALPAKFWWGAEQGTSKRQGMARYMNKTIACYGCRVHYYNHYCKDVTTEPQIDRTNLLASQYLSIMLFTKPFDKKSGTERQHAL
jgi:hypothetical protein